MSLFKMTSEQRADHAISTRLYVSYFGTVLIAAFCLYMAKSFGIGTDTFRTKESGVLMLAAISTLTSAARILRMPWKALTVMAIVSGVIVFAILMLTNVGI